MVADAKNTPTRKRMKHRERLGYLTFAQKWLGLGPVNKRRVVEAASNALMIPCPIKAETYEVLKQFYETFRHSPSPTTKQLVPRFNPRRKEGHREDHRASHDFLLTFEWRQLRMIVLKKRGARCECCGASPRDGIVIHVDHIKPRRKYPELALTESNLQVLCEVCNHGKGSWDETDWRADSQTSGEALRTPVTRSGDGDGNHSLTALPRLVRRTQEERGDISTRLDLSKKKMA